MNDTKEQALDSLRGSFLYVWALLGAIDLILGVLGSLKLMENGDFSQGGMRMAFLTILLLTNLFAFYSGSRFQASKNRAKLADDAQALVDTYKAAAAKTERNCEERIRTLEHKVEQLTTQLEGERTRSANAASLQHQLSEATKAAKEAETRCIELEAKTRDLENTIAAQKNSEDQRLSEAREHVIRAHNLIDQLNRAEAKALRSLVNGNNQLVITDPGTTGLLAYGAIKLLGDTGSYIPGRGQLGYFAVDPLWKTYANWEAKLLDQHADKDADKPTLRRKATRAIREAIDLGLVIQDDGLYLPDDTGAYKRIVGRKELIGDHGEAEKRKVFDSLNEREKWCLAHIDNVSPKKFSVSGSLLAPSFEILVREGIALELEREVTGEQQRRVYAINPEWRSWLDCNRDELPDPNAPMPS